MAMGLSDRMEKILGMCDLLPVWADIGCDHGRVSAELVLRGRAQRVIAADVSLPSLNKARDLSLSLGLTDKIECRHGDGMTVLGAGEAQGVVIAGMGTPLIERIISASLEPARISDELILSPNNYPHRLRRWLYENGFFIEAECAASDDGRFYPIMRAKRGEMPMPSERELYTGVNVKRDETFFAYIDWLTARETDIISGIDPKNVQAAEHLRFKRIYEEVSDDKR